MTDDLKPNPMNTCGARTRAGTPCRRRPVHGRSRCCLHGGKSSGPVTPEGKARAAHPSHGIYAAGMTSEEVEAVSQRGDTLEHELVVARVQLRRALLAWNEWSEANPENLPADEYTLTSDKRSKTVTVRRRRPDLWAIIDRAVGRIGKLVEQRARLVEETGSDPERQYFQTQDSILSSMSTPELMAIRAAMKDPENPLGRALMALLKGGLLPPREVEEAA